MFEIRQRSDELWMVFLVNPDDPKDAYAVSSPLSKRDAEYYLEEFNRIAAIVSKKCPQRKGLLRRISL